MPNDQKPLIILSAGGTGGHVMPAQALPHDLIARGYRIAVISDPRGMKYADGFGADITVHEVKAGTLGKGIAGKVKGLANLALGILQARKIIRRLNPAAVIGFGGYPSVPGVLRDVGRAGVVRIAVAWRHVVCSNYVAKPALPIS